MDLPRDTAVQTCLRKTRYAVALWLLPVAALAVAAHRIAAQAAATAPDPPPRRGLPNALILVLIASVVVRRAWANRAALRDPDTRFDRFWRASVASAGVGTLAAALGLAAALSSPQSPQQLFPYWVTATAAIALAFPRGYELDDLDHPDSAPWSQRPRS